MKIKQTRIRSVSKIRRLIHNNQRVIVSVPADICRKKVVEDFGFDFPLVNGQSLLPAVNGPVSDYNANGKYIIHKDQEKETAYRQVQWTWKQWDGYGSSKEVTETREVAYERYPRTFVSPPSVEFTVATDLNGEALIISPEIVLDYSNPENFIHVVNVLLENFGECEILDEHLDSFVVTGLQKLNWKILPPGRRPWAELRSQIRSVINNAEEGNQPVIEARFEHINGFNPDFAAVGNAGFLGYVVFGFTSDDLFIFESTQVNNATYVFSGDWERLSQMSKAEILNEDLQEHRVIHRRSWFNNISTILGESQLL